MRYELYADSLWMLNFVMNLYLLLLVDRSLLCTATRRRIVLGAGTGAACYLLPFLLGGPVWAKYLAGVLSGTAAMLLIAFRPRGLRAFRRILEKLFLYSFLLGGLLLFLTESFPALRGNGLCSYCILGLGAMGFLLLYHLQRVQGERRRDSSCEATLTRSGRQVRVTALVDSGNSLMEPISGKPVSIIDREIFQSLWEGDEPFRAVPYHSVGKKRGILRGYVLPELHIEVEGMEKCFQNVYVAVSEEYAGGIKMILNPALMQDSGGV